MTIPYHSFWFGCESNLTANTAAIAAVLGRGLKAQNSPTSDNLARSPSPLLRSSARSFMPTTWTRPKQTLTLQLHQSPQGCVFTSSAWMVSKPQACSLHRLPSDTEHLWFCDFYNVSVRQPHHKNGRPLRARTNHCESWRPVRSVGLWYDQMSFTGKIRPWQAMEAKNMQGLYTFPPQKKGEKGGKKTIMLPSLADLLSVQAPSLVDSQSVEANSAKTFSSGSIPKSEPMATPQPLQPKWGLSCLSLGSWSFLPHHVEAVEPHPETAFGWGIQGPIAPCACRRIRIGLSLLGFPEVWPRSHSDTCCSWCQRTRLRLRSKLHSFPESIWKYLKVIRRYVFIGSGWVVGPETLKLWLQQGEECLTASNYGATGVSPFINPTSQLPRRQKI